MKRAKIGNVIKKLSQLALYPFFVASYPVLALLAFNLGQVNASAGIRPLVLSILGVAVLFLLLRLIYRNWHRAAFVSAGLVLLFYTYGHVYDLVSSRWNVIHLDVWMVASWLLLAILAVLAATSPRIRFRSATLTLNVITLGLLLFPIFQMIQWSPQKPAGLEKEPFLVTQELQVPQGQVPPDIYYIMPEDYGRVDMLQSKFHIDVSQFVHDLKDMGFYVAECSQSNYVWSNLSLGSSLNMEYLQNLDGGFKPDSTSQRPIRDAIRHSAVVRDLQEAGYKTVAFATGFAWSELDNADVYLSLSDIWFGLTDFELLLLHTTPARHLEGSRIFDLDRIDSGRYRERTMLVFNSMEKLARMPGPKFVFAHIINPHEPFVFGPDGSPIDPEPFMNERGKYPLDKYILGFQMQIPFVNRMLAQSIKTLINEFESPPIIILQTDTGPLYTYGSDHFKILNAYYLPDHTDALYPGISPVNTFRLIFNTYFGTNYPLLEDISYKSSIPHIYDFSEVPNPCTVR